MASFSVTIYYLNDRSFHLKIDKNIDRYNQLAREYDKMVFQPEARFQQFVHCKFRENIVRMLYIPTLENGNVFLIVNKFGKIGLYHPEKFTLIHTYILDLSVPMHPQMPKGLRQMAKRNREIPPPKCQRIHLVIDACFAPDAKSVLFITTKSILQWYDIGEIEKQSIGLEIFPRKEFLTLKSGESPVPLKNKGHVETHRVFGLREYPTCMEYYGIDKSDSKSNSEDTKMSKLLIGDGEGCVTVILIDNPRKPLGFRKIRGVLHEIKAMELVSRGHLMVYKAHNDLVNEIQYIHQRQLIISCSRDKKFSLFVKDFTETVDPYIISLPKGVTCFEHSESLKRIATGSDDHVVRLFNQFVVNMPQMELMGHRSPIISIKFLQVPFSENSLLLSLSTDVELRAWNPIDFICLQSVYISFPIRPAIMCKTPEFAKRCLYVFQPHYNDEVKLEGKIKDSSKVGVKKKSDQMQRDSDGQIILLYCNSFATLEIEKETSYWPFDFEDFITDFQEATSIYEKKIRMRQQSVSKNPKIVTLTPEEIQGIENNLDLTVKDILKIKKDVDKQLGLTRRDSGNPGLSIQISNKLQSMRHRSGSEGLSKEEFVKRGAVFRSFPLYDVPTLNFITNNKMPVTDLMRGAGIYKVTSIEDLLTQKAKKCFSQENLERKQREDAFFQNNDDKELQQKLEEELCSGSEYEDNEDENSMQNEFTQSDNDEYLETSLKKLSEFQGELHANCD